MQSLLDAFYGKNCERMACVDGRFLFPGPVYGGIEEGIWVK